MWRMGYVKGDKQRYLLQLNMEFKYVSLYPKENGK